MFQPQKISIFEVIGSCYRYADDRHKTLKPILLSENVPKTDNTYQQLKTTQDDSYHRVNTSESL